MVASMEVYLKGCADNEFRSSHRHNLPYRDFPLSLVPYAHKMIGLVCPNDPAARTVLTHDLARVSLLCHYDFTGINGCIKEGRSFVHIF